MRFTPSEMRPMAGFRWYHRLLPRDVHYRCWSHPVSFSHSRRAPTCGDGLLVATDWIVEGAHIESKEHGIDSPVESQEYRAGDGNQAAVQDTVEDGLRVRRNQVAPFADTAADRIQHPEEPDPAA